MRIQVIKFTDKHPIHFRTFYFTLFAIWHSDLKLAIVICNIMFLWEKKLKRGYKYGR